MGLEPLRLHEEQALVDRARCDPEAFGELYERYCHPIYTFAYGRPKPTPYPQTPPPTRSPQPAIESSDIAGGSVLRAYMRSVWMAVDTLPRHQRTAITLRFSADLSNNTIARVMGKSTPAIKQLLHRGVHALRVKLAVGEIQGQATQGDVSAQYV